MQSGQAIAERLGGVSRSYDLENYLRAFWDLAIRESDSNASKTVLEKLMRASQSYAGGQTSQADQFTHS
jgi:hypothetical protein